MYMQLMFLQFYVFAMLLLVELSCPCECHEGIGGSVGTAQFILTPYLTQVSSEVHALALLFSEK
jgi:hypothetical protein